MTGNAWKAASSGNPRRGPRFAWLRTRLQLCGNLWRLSGKGRKLWGGNNSLTVVWSVLPILTNLSFHSWFGDVDGRLCVKLQASARLSLFPNDVSKQSMRIRNKTSYAFLKFTVVQNKHYCCWLTCREHLGHRWHSGIPYQSARWRWCHRLHLLRGLHSLDMKEKKTARRWFISFFLCVCFCVCCDLKQIHKQDWSYLVVPCKTNLLLLPPPHNVLP